MKCFDKMKDDASVIFKKFYEIGDNKLQDQYLFGLVECLSEKKQEKPRKETPRERTAPIIYHVKLLNGERCVICQKCFLHVHSIDRSRIRRITESNAVTSPPPDKRGKQPSANKTPAEILTKIRNHIKTFDAQKSHYSLKDNPNRRYLPEYLNVKRMWKSCVRLYEPEKWAELQSGKKYSGMIKEWQYRRIFQDEFNLSFGYPRTDTCGKCDLLQTKLSIETDIQEKMKVQDELKKHINLADQAYDEMKHDKLIADATWKEQNRLFSQDKCSKDTTDMYSFDFQQNFMAPNFTHGEMYYSRQLNIFNFGVHDHVSNDTVMCIYPETIAKKGGSEVASCLRKVLMKRNSGSRKIIFYSDGCGGQNRNHQIVCFFQGLIHKGIYESIEHKILVRGHTRLVNDRDFGLIQQRMKLERIIMPDDYEKVVKSARSHPSPFAVVQMDTGDFFYYGTLSKTSIKMQFKDQNMNNVAFLTISWFSYGKSEEQDWQTGETVEVNHPSEFWARYTLDRKEEWKKINLLKRNPYDHGVQPKYSGLIPIKAKKWLDIQKQIQYIAKVEKRSYYEGLPHEGTGNDENESESDFCDDSD